MAHDLYLGDCLEGMKALPDKSVGHVICDPPYEAEAHTLQRRTKTDRGDGRQAGGGDRRITVVEPLSFHPMTEDERASAAAAMARVARRWIIVFCQAEAVPAWRSALEAGGAVYKRAGVWVKPDAQPQLTGDRPGMGYESIVFAHRKGRSTWNGGGRVGVFTFNKNGGTGPNEHETQKPLPLMLELVSLFTDPGELVLDAFAGSGTTGVACLRLGRRFIGIEKDAKYAAIARERLRAEQDGLSLRDARAGQLPMFGASK